MGSGRAAARGVTASVLLAALSTATPALGWGEHEHVRIGRVALDALGRCAGPADECGYYAVLVREWLTLRATDATLTASDGSPLLCEGLVDDGRCIDLADLPMLAGDHACTPDDLHSNLQEGWVFDVISVTEDKIAETTQLLLESNHSETVEDQRLEIRRELDVELQVADPQYVSRAAGNAGHFAIPLSSVSMDLDAYVEHILPPSPAAAAREPRRYPYTPDQVFLTKRHSSAALYLHYHAWALHFATRAAGKPGAVVERRAAWLHEVYALHFLQDSFSAGHIVGSPESDALRFGTHDHYCQHGLNTSTWGSSPGGGVAYVAHGDAFLMDADLDRLSPAMLASLRQLASAFAGEDALTGALSADEWRVSRDRPPGAGAVDTCHSDDEPLTASHFSREMLPPLKRVMTFFPRPAVGPEPWTERGDDHVVPLPSFRAEYGAFVPFVLDVRVGGALYTGDADIGERIAITPEVFGGVGFGGSGEGVFSTADDAIAYAMPIGVLGVEAVPFNGLPTTTQFGPATGVGFRARIPFAYVPGDVLIWGPIAAAQLRPGFKAFQRALRGGLFSSESVFFIGPVRLQIELGREVDVVWRYGVQAFLQGDGTYNHVFGHRGWDLTAPILSTRLLKGFDGQRGITSSFRLSGRVGYRRTIDAYDIEPAAQASDVGPTGVHLGLVLGIDTMIRRYFN